MNDGESFSCHFNYDASGNNTVDFGFYNPTVSASGSPADAADAELLIFPNPTQHAFYVQGDLSAYRVEVLDGMGRLLLSIPYSVASPLAVDLSAYSKGSYFAKATHQTKRQVLARKIALSR